MCGLLLIILILKQSLLVPLVYTTALTFVWCFEIISVISDRHKYTFKMEKLGSGVRYKENSYWNIGKNTTEHLLKSTIPTLACFLPGFSFRINASTANGLRLALWAKTRQLSLPHAKTLEMGVTHYTLIVTKQRTTPLLI